MSGGTHHVDEVADLGAGTMPGRIDDDGEIEMRIIALQPVEHGEGRVGGMLHAEDDLHAAGIFLLAEGAQ